MTGFKSARGVLLLGVVFLAFAAVYGYYSIFKTPRIEVTPSFMNLGDVTEEGFNYTFTVKNLGDRPLKINKVTTSCGCTLATIDSDSIDPGEVAGLHVSFNPSFMKEEIRGGVSRTIFVKSNDPENPDIEIKIKANVVEG
jgi:uncharacterized YccA/Bax inhibitor family protein